MNPQKRDNAGELKEGLTLFVGYNSVSIAVSGFCLTILLISHAWLIKLGVTATLGSTEDRCKLV